MITCENCLAACCREVSVELDAPQTLEERDGIRWMVAHENVAVYMNEDNC